MNFASEKTIGEIAPLRHGDKATKCPNCGADNSDDASYCGTCAVWLKDGSVLPASTQVRMADKTGASSRSSALSIATFALTIALVLLSLGFAVYVYYIEGFMLNQERDYGAFVNISKAMFYSTQLGNLAEILGLIFIMQALITHPSRAALLAYVLKGRLSVVKWMLILAAILFAVGLSVYFSASELKVRWDSEVFLRVYTYAAQIAWLLAAAALLVFALSLREAERLSP